MHGTDGSLWPSGPGSAFRGAGVGVLGGVFGGLGGGVVAEADFDGLVVAAALGADQVAEHAPVGVGEVVGEGQGPRVELAGQHRVQFRGVHADLGQQELQ